MFFSQGGRMGYPALHGREIMPQYDEPRAQDTVGFVPKSWEHSKIP